MLSNKLGSNDFVAFGKFDEFSFFFFYEYLNKSWESRRRATLSTRLISIQLNETARQRQRKISRIPVTISRFVSW